jgi:hypothetical protein
MKALMDSTERATDSQLRQLLGSEHLDEQHQHLKWHRLGRHLLRLHWFNTLHLRPPADQRAQWGG